MNINLRCGHFPLIGMIIGFLLVGLTLAVAAPASDDPTPRYITYYNSDDSPLSAALDTPYTHIILAFITASVDDQNNITLHTNKHLDTAWNVVPELQKKGKKVMISFGGGLLQAAEYAPLAGREAELGKLLADFIRTKGLDGIDIDYEASATFHTERPAGIIDGRKFVIALTKALRLELPAPDYLLSHAPQPPYLFVEWHGGAYLDILKVVGDQIDWIIVQYYNNPGFDSPNDSQVVGRIGTPYPTSFHGLTDASGSLRWPANKIVVGKPVHKTNVQSGYSLPEDLIQQIIRPLQKVYGNQFGGIMGWQFDSHGNDHPAWNTIVGQVLLDPAKDEKAPD